MKSVGIHLLLDLWECNNTNDATIIEKSLRDAVDAIDATLLDIKIKAFSPHGVTGIAIIAESHISIHTWPEHNYLAVDIFTCGELDPEKAIAVFKKAFSPNHIEVTEIKRGLLF